MVERLASSDYAEEYHRLHTMTIQQLGIQWIAACKERVLAENTYRNYQSNLKANILPYIGEIRIAELTTEMVDDLLERLQEYGKREYTVYQVRSTIQTLLRYGMREGVLSKNVAANSRVKLVRSPVVEKVHYDCRDIAWLFRIASAHKLEMVMLLTACYGLRIGEALGLRWSNIDFSTGTIYITEQLPPRLPSKQKAIKAMDPLKTDKGKRELPLTPQLYPYFQRAYHWANVTRYDEGFTDNDLVVCQRDGSPEQRKCVLERFHQLCRSADIGIGRIHDFRHSAASNMFQLTGDLFSISKILGQSISGTSSTLGNDTAMQTVTDQYILPSVNRTKEVLTQYHQSIFPQGL